MKQTMNRIRILSHSEADFPAPFPAAMLPSTSPGIVTDTAPLTATLEPTSRSTIADVTSLNQCSCLQLQSVSFEVAGGFADKLTKTWPPQLLLNLA